MAVVSLSVSSLPSPPLPSDPRKLPSRHLSVSLPIKRRLPPAGLGTGAALCPPRGPVAAPQNPVSSEMSLSSPGLQEGEGDVPRERRRGCRCTGRTDASQRRTFILRVACLRRINISTREHCIKRSFLAPFVHPHLSGNFHLMLHVLHNCVKRFYSYI